MPKIKKDKKEKDKNIDTNKIIKLENNIEEVKYIIHCADIHIKNDQTNRLEYDIVLNRLYESIKNLKNLKNTIIVICGDIFDNKTNLRPESIDLLKEFFFNLSNLTDTIVILGNHDQNSNNSKSLDAISPIINKGFNSKYKIHLLKDSGIYEYSNLVFGLTDIHQEKVTSLNINVDKIKINLYHGYIHGAKLQNDMSHMVGKFNQTDFSDGQLTLLGDIHKFQYLNKNKTMAYPGSLLQMNYGEDLYNHGYLLWNLKDMSSELIKIANDYAFYTIEIHSNKLVTEIDKDLPKNLRLRVFYKDSDVEHREEIINTLKQKYNIIQLDELKQMKGINLELNTDEKNKKIQQISSINNVNELILKYITDNNKIENKLTEEKIKEISDELTVITKKIDYNFEKTKKKIKILKLEFNNMFIYGENNVINFDNLNKIVGLVAENKRGKTSLIDCILFSIWSESDRTISNIDVIKHGTKKMSSDITISVNSNVYKISRQSYNSKGRLYNEVNLYEFDKDTFEQKKLTESDKRKTEEKILSLFGSPDDFTLLSIITQDNPINFLTMKDTEKKALLNKMFNLEIIKDVNREVNKEHLALTKMNKEYDIINRENDVTNTLSLIDKYSSERKELNEKYIKKGERRDNIKKEIIVLEYKLNELNKQVEEINGIEELKTKSEKFSNDINKNEEEIKELEKELIELNKNLDENKWRLEKIGDIENSHKNWKKQRKEKLNKLNEAYQELTEKKKPVRPLSKQESKLKKSLEEKINKLNEEKREKEENYEEYEDYSLIEEYEEKLNEIVELNNNLEKLEIKRLDLEGSLKKLENHKFNKNCEACMSNSITKQRLVLEEEQKEIRKKLDEKQNELNELDNFVNKKKKKYDKLIASKSIKDELDRIIEELNSNKKQIKEINKLEKEFNKAEEYNKKINEEIELNRKDFTLEENQQDLKYDEFIEIRDKVNEQINELNEIKDKLNSLINKNDKLNRKKEEIDNLINKYNSNKKLYDEIENIKIDLESEREKEREIDCECKEVMIKLSNLTKDLNKLDSTLQIIQKNKEIISKNNKRKEILGIIKSATDSGGILDEILKDIILPSIETIVNDILNDVDTYKIKIAYDSFIKITKIENNTEQESSGLMASGHEKSVLNIIFRLALSKLNSMISTNFFIIDEAFKNSDSNKKQKLKTLFEYLRNNYDYVLVVTHDDYIKDNFDKEINIEHNNGTSLIKFS